MKTITTTTESYSFDELDREAKEIAIWNEQIRLNENDHRGRIFTKKQAIASIKQNGDLFHVTGYYFKSTK